MEREREGKRKATFSNRIFTSNMEIHKIFELNNLFDPRVFAANSNLLFNDENATRD